MNSSRFGKLSQNSTSLLGAPPSILGPVPLLGIAPTNNHGGQQQRPNFWDVAQTVSHVAASLTGQTAKTFNHPLGLRYTLNNADAVIEWDDPNLDGQNYRWVTIVKCSSGQPVLELPASRRDLRMKLRPNEAYEVCIQAKTIPDNIVVAEDHVRFHSNSFSVLAIPTAVPNYEPAVEGGEADMEVENVEELPAVRNLKLPPVIPELPYRLQNRTVLIDGVEPVVGEILGSMIIISAALRDYLLLCLNYSVFADAQPPLAVSDILRCYRFDGLQDGLVLITFSKAFLYQRIVGTGPQKLTDINAERALLGEPPLSLIPCRGPAKDAETSTILRAKRILTGKSGLQPDDIVLSLDVAKPYLLVHGQFYYTNDCRKLIDSYAKAEAQDETDDDVEPAGASASGQITENRGSGENRASRFSQATTSAVKDDARADIMLVNVEKQPQETRVYELPRGKDSFDTVSPVLVSFVVNALNETSFTNKRISCDDIAACFRTNDGLVAVRFFEKILLDGVFDPGSRKRAWQTFNQSRKRLGLKPIYMFRGQAFSERERNLLKYVKAKHILQHYGDFTNIDLDRIDLNNSSTSLKVERDQFVKELDIIEVEGLLKCHAEGQIADWLLVNMNTYA